MPAIALRRFLPDDGGQSNDRAAEFGYLGPQELFGATGSQAILPLDSFETPIVNVVGFNYGTIRYSVAGGGAISVKVFRFDPDKLTAGFQIDSVQIGLNSNNTITFAFGSLVALTSSSGDDFLADWPLGFISLFFTNTSATLTLTASNPRLMMGHR